MYIYIVSEDHHCFGAYTTYVTQLIFKLPFLKPYYNSYILVSIIFAFIVSGVVGILLEKSIIRKLYGSPLETLLATWGVSLILQQFVRSVPLAYGTSQIARVNVSFYYSRHTVRYGNVKGGYDPMEGAKGQGWDPDAKINRERYTPTAATKQFPMTQLP